MDGFGAVLARGVQNAVDTQIAFAGRRGSHPLGFVGHAHVQRRAIGVGEDGHRGDFHFAQRADDAHGDFAAVGNQDLAEHPVNCSSRPGRAPTLPRRRPGKANRRRR